MADKKINDLPALVSQATTDVYEVSNNAATLSSKETRAQMLSYFQTNIGTTLQNSYANGNGTITLDTNKPFKLISTVSGFMPPAMTTAQFSSIGTLNNGEIAWNTTVDRLTTNANTDGDRRIELFAYLSDLEDLETDATFGELYFTHNASATTFASPATPVKVNGTYSIGDAVGFSVSSGALVYADTVTRTFLLTTTLTATYAGSSNNTTFMFMLRRSAIETILGKSKQQLFIGGASPALQSGPISCTLTLAQGDQIEVWVQNDDSTNPLTVQDLNFKITAIGGISSGSSLTVRGEYYLDYTANVLTANPIDLTGTNVTGILKAGSSPALTGDVTKTGGNFNTVVAKINGATLGTTTATSGNLLIGSGTAWVTQAMSGDATINASGALTIANDAVTFAKMQNMSANTLLGSEAGGSPEQITVGSGLTLSGGVLTADSVTSQVEVIGTMLLGTSSYTSGVQASVINTIDGSKTILANTLEIGESVELSVIGLTSSVTSGGSGVITCKFGALTFNSATATSILGGAGSTRSWNVTFKVTRVASTSVSISAAGFYEDDSHVVQSLRLYSTPVVHTGFDFTINNDIDVLYTMTASGGNAYNFIAVNLNIVKFN